MSAKQNKASFVTGANTVALGILVAMIFPAMVAFGQGERALEVFGAVAVLAAATLGIPAALRHVKTAWSRRHPPMLGELDPPRTVSTHSGRLPRREAMVQVLIVPVSTFVAMCLIGLVQILVG